MNAPRPAENRVMRNASYRVYCTPVGAPDATGRGSPVCAAFDRGLCGFLYYKNAMLILITIVHVIVCIFLIIVVLLQSGKAADLAGAFGGMGSQTAFGPRGSATLLSQVTTASAIVFMITSLSLSILATRGAAAANTVLDKSQGG